MSERPMFVPECWVDTALMRTLLFDRTLYNHQHGIGNVGRTMKDQAKRFGPARVVVGMVDRDKKFDEQPYLKAFTSPARVRPDQATYHVLIHPALPSQRLIVLNPACDVWIFQVAQAAGINPATYGLPETLHAFIDFCKQRGVDDNTNLRAFLKAIRKASPPAYQELADAVNSMLAPV